MMLRRNRERRRALGLASGLLLAAFVLVGCVAAMSPMKTENYQGREIAANEVIVKFRGAPEQVISQVEIAGGLDEREYIGSARAMRLHSRVKNAATLIRELSARADVEYVEPNYIVHALATPDDPLYSKLWGLSTVSAPAAWDISTGSAENVVAIVDTGIDYNHPDLAGNVWSAPEDFTVTIGGTDITCLKGSHGFNAITKSCDPMDDHGHGTHVSGTIGAVGNNNLGVVGVNWRTGIMGTKFLNSGGAGTISDAINAIDFAIQARARFGAGANVRVLSASWGGPDFSQALLDEINKADTHDMLFVAAAGNNGRNNDLTPLYPASYESPNVVAVAATNQGDLLPSFSNWGPTSVDLGAPGDEILSTIPGGNYASLRGTSMATPHVSGAAALVLSRCALNTADLKDDILNNVDPVPSLAGKTVTGGRLNVYKALQACSEPISVPEFPTAAVPILIISGMVFAVRITRAGERK